MDAIAQLVEDHRPLVRIVIGKLARRGVLGCMERTEVEQVALIGLWDAARRYQAGGPASFRTFAAPRVEGAILDARRSSGPMSRREYRLMRAGLLQRFIEPLDDLLVERLPSPSVVAVDPWRDAHVAEALLQLPPRLARIVHLLYWEERQLTEVADLMGIGVTRAGQLRGVALRRLSALLAAVRHG